MKKTWNALAALLLAFALTLSVSSAAAADPPVAEPPAPEAGADEKLTAYGQFQQIMEIYLATHIDEPEKSAVYENMIRMMLERHPELLYEMANMAMSSYDPYSHYFTPEQLGQILDTPAYIGLGVAFEHTERGCILTEVYAGSAAHNAGLRPGDMITHIGGREIADYPTSWIQQLLSGPEGKAVTLTYSREGALQTVRVHLSSVRLPSVSFNTIGTTGIGLIRVSEFVEGKTLNDFFNALLRLSGMGVSELIIDMRNNPGGELISCLNMINYLTPTPGAELCTLLPRDEGKAETFYSQGTPFTFGNVKILVNENTVSAAELFSVSLQQNGAAELIGTKTFGKAVAQTYYPLADGGAAAVTTFEILAPGRIHYNGIGVQPDVESVIKPHIIERNTFSSGSYPAWRYLTEAVPGAENSIVFALEERLMKLGYMPEADRVFNESTALAIRAFQNSSGLCLTSSLNLETLVRLRAAVEDACTDGIVTDDQMNCAVERILSERPPVE